MSPFSGSVLSIEAFKELYLAPLKSSRLSLSPFVLAIQIHQGLFPTSTKKNCDVSKCPLSLKASTSFMHETTPPNNLEQPARCKPAGSLESWLTSSCRSGIA
jgi:hypothetical protein